MDTGGKLLWDLPTRGFHWSLVICIPLAWWSAEEGNYELHEWLGCTLLVLVVFRIIWGFLGSRHSRFADFLVGPRRGLAYLRGEAPATPGHNPLGGWSVLLMLGLLLLQAFSGLFNTDDVLYSGPLHYAASTGFRDAMGALHEIAFNALLLLVLFHIVAIVVHQRRGHKLVQAMVRGQAPGKEGQGAVAPLWLALLLVILLALALWLGLSKAPQPAPMW